MIRVMACTIAGGLAPHMEEAVPSLAICLAGNESVCTGRPVNLKEAPWAP